MLFWLHSTDPDSSSGSISIYLYISSVLANNGGVRAAIVHVIWMYGRLVQSCTWEPVLTVRCSIAFSLFLHVMNFLIVHF